MSEERIVTMTTDSAAPVITPEQLLTLWQGHRRVTRRVIDAFPDDQLFTFSIGGMRTFGDLATEFLRMSVPTLRGIKTGNWDSTEKPEPKTKAEVLKLWDADSAEIDRVFPTVPTSRFQETDTAFGQWKMQVYDLLFYIIDNEIHHRGQGYVYLRALGIEPPAFYDRS
jgi:uncharacterized damage-inducible protein DinB